MSAFCCVDRALAVKLIGTFGLSLSILMINMLVSNFFARPEEEDFILAIESWVLFGLNWTFVMRNLQVVETAQALMTCVIIYTLISLFANALLALGALLRKPSYTLPYMYIQMISIADQTFALMIQLAKSGDSQNYDKSGWYIPACSAYLLLSAYFWMIVSDARREWLDNERTSEIEAALAGVSRHSQLQGNAMDSNLPKTPSYISTGLFSFDRSPCPPSRQIFTMV
ncbi:uncharacterized protein LOC106650062 [Trichogramma pretiosum]|uniref:uncharacterized protein LOC106650062 n=1 Tax=Trichogramma pretiosum TaxID=7493 RepID=UPI0006C9A337|nr:uncharacterized protein LOC106650062 [Trichogramma pretiosum]